MLRKLLAFSAAMLISLQVSGGVFPVQVGSTLVSGGGGDGLPHWYCMSLVDTGVVSTAGSEEVTSPMPAIPTSATLTSFANRELVTMYPPGQNSQWSIQGMSVTVISALGAAEDCMISVMHSPVGAGSETVAVQIGIGANATLGNDTGGTCEFSALGADATNVDDVGDYCIQVLSTPVLAPAGSGLRFRFGDEDLGGANTCTIVQTIDLCLLGQLIGEYPYH